MSEPFEGIIGGLAGAGEESSLGIPTRVSRRELGLAGLLVGRDSVEPGLDLGSRDFRPTAVASDFFAMLRVRAGK